MNGPKVIIVTGASRGIGAAVVQKLLENSHKLVLVARSAEPLHRLKEAYPDQVETVVADISSFPVAEQVIEHAVNSFSRIDGLILNHGILGAVTRVADANLDAWQEVFNVNFLSCVAFVKAAVPHLRQTQGKIIMTSSGAASGAYATWGAYGSSKAAMNHLTMTLKVEEPTITTIAVRPGVVDTSMQQAIREKHHSVMDEKDVAKFKTLHETGGMIRPEQPGTVIANLAVDADVGLSGMYLSWDDNSLIQYRN